MAVLRRVAEKPWDDSAEGRGVATPDGLARKEADEAVEVRRFRQDCAQGLCEAFDFAFAGLAVQRVEA